jgi:acyl-homoserine lactone acylase PvdQ
MKRSMSRGLLALALAALAVLPASAAAAVDHSDVARNIIPSGQWGGFPTPAGAGEQAEMYDGLTPLFDQVTPADLDTYFKSARLAIAPDGPATEEQLPRDDVRILRDRFNVPHVRAETAEAGIWAAGWIAVEDRGLLLNQARYNARVAAVDAPGLSAIGLVSGLRNFVPSEATEVELSKQTRVLRKRGREGRRLLADIDAFVRGINAHLAESSPSTAPFTRRDIYAFNALKGQFLGQGGGDEARRSQFLGGLQERLGKRRGMSVFNDLRQFKNPGAPTAIDGKFRYGSIPKRARGSVVLDPGSFESTPAVAPALARGLEPEPAEASNTLHVNADRSTTGHPLMVGGPQIGYFYPGLTYEIVMDAGRLQWRGATSMPFPGYLLIGRGSDFAVTLTSAGSDIIDQYAVRLCGGSEERYVYRGRCRKMKRFEAGTLDGSPVSFLRTVHGPVVGYATAGGKRVALASKRSSYGRDILDQLFFRRLSNGTVRDPKSFFRAAAKTPQTFNSFYMDHRHNAAYLSGRLPLRPKGTDPGLPTKGNGRWEWRGFLKKERHPRGVDPRRGTMLNWNENLARGFGAADNSWGRAGNVGRISLLRRNMRLAADENGKWDLAAVTSAMNAAATQDVRAIFTVPLLRAVLEGSPPPNAQAGEMLELLRDWRHNGGSRLDRNLDGLIDHPGAATMDVAWPKIADAFMRPQLGPQLDELHSLFSRFDLPPSGQYSGWYQYFDRDIRKLLGQRVRKPFTNSYCGRGKPAACRQALWTALAEAGAELEAEHGSSDPHTWRSDAARERIGFVPGLLGTTMRYTNRPTGIQQVISFNSHR